MRFYAENRKKTIKKLLFWLGLVFNIGLIVWFKYYDFFVGTINTAFKTNFTLFHIMLPLGISFFTFQQISFVIDSSRGSVPRYNLLDYMLFVTFFPQLIACPIVMHSEIIPQFEDVKNHKINYANLSKAITAFSIGLAKKVLIADTLGLFSDAAFTNVSALNGTESIFAILAYVFQIYFDFSGYCDMAIGIGYSFNIKLPLNFNSPYKSKSIQEFWKKWHITLGRFLTWYIFIPLSIRKNGQKKADLNLMIVFLISGLWHGAGWNYILFGVIYGLANIFEHHFGTKMKKLPGALQWLYTFIVITVASTVFRVPKLSDTAIIFGNLFKKPFGSISKELLGSLSIPEISIFTTHTALLQLVLLITMIIFSFWLVLRTKNTSEIIQTQTLSVKRTIGNTVLLIWSILSLSSVSSFLYFNF